MTKTTPRPEPAAGMDRPNAEVALRSYWRRTADSGTTWPSEPVLAVELGVSRAALREALIRLEAEGLIRRRHGDGTYVNRQAASIKVRFDQQAQFELVLREAGLDGRPEQLRIERVALDATEAGTLNVAAGSPALRAVKRWWVGDQVVMVAIDTVPLTRSDGTALKIPDTVTFSEFVRLFPLVHQVRNDTVEWEIAHPGAHLLAADERALFADDVPDAVLELNLYGITRRGEIAYGNLEWHRPGVVPFGYIRNVRS